MKSIFIFFLLLKNSLTSFNLFELKKEINSKKYKIYYNEEFYKLSEKNKNLLLKFIINIKEKLEKNKDAVIVLKGYDQYNDSLEEKTEIINNRLLEIREFLIKNGIKENRIECINYNDITLDPYDDDICDQSNRVVTLYFKFAKANFLSTNNLIQEEEI